MMHQNQEMPIISQQQQMNVEAAKFINYANLINNYKYKNHITDGTINNSLLPADNPVEFKELHNIVVSERLYVYTMNKNGLKAALINFTRHSALICTVKNGQLIDNLGRVFLPAPSTIPENSLVYIN